jgi:hypothetical protein
MAESFHEYRHVRQTPGEPRLRWFLSDFFELFVWFEEDHPIAFRLCYDRGYQEHAITWEKATGHIRHEAVDSGGGTIESHGPAPILVSRQHSIPSRVVERFQNTPGEVPEEIRHLVLEHLSTVKSET